MMLIFSTLCCMINRKEYSMQDKEVGKYLKRVRESLKLTQEDVAKKLDLGRDAILRIENGKRKISALELVSFSKIYGIDLEEFMIGPSKKKKDNIKGIILAGGSGTRLYPITEATSKQLLPIYDKPMIYYPLSVLMEAGIRDILIITTKEDQPAFKRLLKDGSELGINLSYIIQPSPDGLAQAFILGEEFIGNNACAMILGDNIYYGNNLEKELLRAKENALNGYATIFGYKVHDPERFGIMEIDEIGNVLSVEEKPINPKSDYAITGLYFYPKGVSKLAKKVKPSDRGELEITSLNDLYLQKNNLKSILLGDGYTWFDTGTFSSLLEASNMIRTLENNKDSVICCPEMIAYRNRWIDIHELAIRGNIMKKNSYGEYLLKEVEKERINEEVRN